MVTDTGFTVWFTGMTGSGKSTLASMLSQRLNGCGLNTEVLDSGRIRQKLNRSLGFTREEIDQSVQRIAYEARLLNRNGINALVAAVSPYRDQRDAVRREVERFIEVYCRCPLEVLAERDKNNLFARARSGEIAHVAGVNAPYEEPLNPDVIIDTNKQSMRGGVRRVMSKLEALGFMPPQTSAEYTADEEALIKQRLRDMGYI